MNKWPKRILILVLPVLVGITLARATPDEAPCGLVMKSGVGAQVIPKQGAVQNHPQDEAPIACAAMLITHQEAFWIKLTDQTTLKIAPQSFVELPKAGLQTYRLYRGQVFVASPPGISTQTWSTSNSEVIFRGGIAYLQYDAGARVSTASCFNREFEFRNKFNESATLMVRAGEISHLAIQEANVSPSTPAVMNHASVVQALKNLKLAESDQSELVAVVKRVYQSREKSLTTEIEDWKSNPHEISETAPVRDVASVKTRAMGKREKSIEPKEAEFVTRLLNEHLYGTEQDQKLAEPVRKPASMLKPQAIRDDERLRQDQTLRKETKRLEKEIGQMKDDE